ncbi:substrate-binding domain-containing protein, partial [Klebsiella variicola]
YLHEQGIAVPGRISIVSFDSVDLCESLYPTVTAVHFPISEMARAAVQSLIAMVKQQPTVGPQSFRPILKKRHADQPLSKIAERQDS